ncbi:hypothetical protein PRZ48_011472 [Zasmidium cellare]|uniref:PARG catalytic Macro domain-containing protein n=1 Tax=Zasmidium cellare TaxID=395010 RepID=A0ABR0E7F4_ZASCE|nr:hypothetical protein PRZ48_011472 [Zasmidium cellare]
MTLYLLPNHPSLSSIDPLGICNSDEAQVPQWDLLKALLAQATEKLQAIEDLAKTSHQQSAWAATFSNILEDIAYSLHGDHGLSTDGLRTLLRSGGLSVSLLRVFRICLFRAALQLEELFSDASLLQLSEATQTASFTRQQTDCLLAHLLLGTLQNPIGNDWGRPGFSQLFTENEATRNTALAYLKTVILQFCGDGYSASIEDDVHFVFTLVNGAQMPDSTTSTTTAEPLPIIIVDQPSEPSPKPAAFVLIAANAQPGPGPAGTQEERVVGQSPALAIASLLAPTLSPSEAVITSPFPVHARWTGHGRAARCVEQINRNERPWRRYVIADALELDLEDDAYETKAENVVREVRKLWAGFEGAKRAWLTEGKALEDLVFEMPPWGCGAFGGSLGVKVACMRMAAALAGLRGENLQLFVPRERAGELGGGEVEVVTVGELFGEVCGGG